MGKKLTLAEAAETLNTSKRTVRRLISSGKLRAYYVAGTRIIRIDADDLAKLLRPVTPLAADRGDG
jgi:excisionase family DNA binding protein